MTKWFTAAASIVTTFCVGYASAQEADDLEALIDEPIVSTPSRSSTSAKAAPATSSVITAEDLRTYGFRSLDEAINFASMGMVTTNPLHAVEIGSRGVLLNGDFGNHVLLLVDGHPLNEPWNSTAYVERGAGIPLELVDHIEVVLGPGSVMYGSQAMLGVINVVTKRAKDYAGQHLIVEGETGLPATAGGSLRKPGLTSDYLSDVGHGYRVGAGTGQTFKLFGVPSELTAQAEYYYSRWATLRYAPQNYGNDAVTGEPKRYAPGSATGIWGGEVDRANYTRVPTAYGRLLVGDFEMSTRVGMYQRGSPHLDSLTGMTADFDDPRTYERDTFFNGVIGYSPQISGALSLRSRAYFDYNMYNARYRSSAAEDCLEGQLAGCNARLDGGGRVFGSELQANYDWLQNGSLVTVLGVAGRVRRATSDYDFVDKATGQPTQLPGGNYGRTDTLAAVYFEQFANLAPALDINAGVRGDFDSRFGSKASPRAAAVVTPWSGAAFKVIYSEAFRGPSVFELLFSAPDWQLAAPHLRPETVRSIESSFEQRFGPHRLFFGVFRSFWTDMVQLSQLDAAALDAAKRDGTLSADVTTAWRYENTAHFDNFGFNAGVEGRALQRRVHYAVNLTSAYTRRDSGDTEPSLPPTVGPQLFGNARISYTAGGDWPAVALAAFAMQGRPADRAYDGGFSRTPYAPASLELRPTLSGSIRPVPGLSYRVSVNYSTARRGAYVVGPQLYAADESTRAALNPVLRLTGYAGLQYDF